MEVMEPLKENTPNTDSSRHQARDTDGLAAVATESTTSTPIPSDVFVNGISNNTSNSNPATTNTSESNIAEEDPDEVLAQLIGMGFDPDICMVAVAECHSDWKALTEASDPNNQETQTGRQSLIELALSLVLARQGISESDVRSVTYSPGQSPRASRPPRKSALPQKSILKSSPEPPRRNFPLNTAMPSSSSNNWFSSKTDQAANILGSVFTKIRAKATDLAQQIAEAASTPQEPELKFDESELESPLPSLENMSNSPKESVIPFTISDGSSQNSLADLPRDSASKVLPPLPNDGKLLDSPTKPTLLGQLPKRVRFSFPDLAIQPDSNANDDVESNQESAGPAANPKERNPRPVEALYQFYLSRCSVHLSHPIPSILAQIQHAFESGLQLSRLYLTGVDLSQINLAPLVDLLFMDFGLAQLDLENTNLTDENLRTLLIAILTTNCVSRISLANNQRIRVEGIKFISVFVKKSTSLRVLDLSGIHFDDKGASYLSQGLAASASIEQLRMDNCRIRASHLEYLVPGIRRSSLRSLSFRDNKMPWACAPFLGDLILSDPTHSSLESRRRLTYLNLRGNEIRHGMTAFCAKLAKADILVDLNLQECKLDASSLCAIADALISKESNVRVLNLAGNEFLFGRKGVSGPDSITALKDALSLNTLLREINLANSGFTSEGAIALAETLPMTKSLRTIDLRHNPLDLAGVMALSVALKLNQTVVSLEVIPFAEHGPGKADADMAQVVNDISIYCQRNHEIQGKIKPLPPPVSEYSGTAPDRRLTTADSLDSFTSTFGSRQPAEIVASSVFDESESPLIRSSHAGESGTKYHIDSAENIIKVLEDVVNVAESGPDPDFELTKILYNQALRTQTKLQEAIGSGSVDDEDELIKCLMLNDQLTDLLAKCEDVLPMDVTQPKASPLEMFDSNGARRVSLSTGTGEVATLNPTTDLSQAKPNSLPPPQQLSSPIKTSIRELLKLPTKSGASSSNHSNSTENQQNADVKTLEKQLSGVSIGSGFAPTVPANQVLVQVEKSTGVTEETSSETFAGDITMAPKTMAQVNPLGKMSFSSLQSVSSDDVQSTGNFSNTNGPSEDFKKGMEEIDDILRLAS